jgi:hypothetical protein
VAFGISRGGTEGVQVVGRETADSGCVHVRSNLEIGAGMDTPRHLDTSIRQLA